MLVVFSSPKTESITMFNNVAVELLKLMGATGRIPGAFSAADLPAALSRLEAGLARVRAEGEATPPRSPDRDREEKDERDREPPVGIAVRAAPLIDLMKRAIAANAALVWESRG